MKKAFLAILFLFLSGSPSLLAAAKYDTRPSTYCHQDVPSVKKHQKKGFWKRAWQSLFPKKHHRQKTASREHFLNFGGGAVLLGLVAVISLFISGFIALAVITWGASIVLGVIGLFKDENKVAAIIALSMALVLPIVVVILFSIYCCGE